MTPRISLVFGLITTLVLPSGFHSCGCFIRIWARAPGKPPSAVLGQWAWFVPWLQRASVPLLVTPLAVFVLAALIMTYTHIGRDVIATGSDRRAITAALEHANKVTEPFAARRMDRSIHLALAGRKLEDMKI